MSKSFGNFGGLRTDPWWVQNHNAEKTACSRSKIKANANKSNSKNYFFSQNQKEVPGFYGMLCRNNFNLHSHNLSSSTKRKYVCVYLTYQCEAQNELGPWELYSRSKNFIRKIVTVKKLKLLHWKTKTKISSIQVFCDSDF